MQDESELDRLAIVLLPVPENVVLANGTTTLVCMELRDVSAQEIP